jgi:hypothetical protein
MNRFFAILMLLIFGSVTLLILHENSKRTGDTAGTPTASASPTPEASISPSPTPSATPPKGSKLGSDAPRLLKPELERYLAALLKEIPVKGEVLSQHQSPNGTLYTVERLKDGHQVFREYDKRGLITAEKLEREKGEEISRTFHDNGFTQALKWRFRNTSMLYVHQDVSGVIVSRTEEFQGGDRVIHEIDQEGRTVDRYLIRGTASATPTGKTSP